LQAPGEYSHSAGRFLHTDTIRTMPTGEGKQGRRPPAAATSAKGAREPAAGTAAASAGTRRRAVARSSPGEAVAARLRASRVCVCVGAGGVGKTTAAAALAVGMAMRGRKVAVVTIDPAPRLAGALGMRHLEGELVRIQPSAFEAQRVPMPGEVWAMRLDVKRTFDDIVMRLAPDERSREEILDNPIYGQLSSSVAGAQELSAVAMLYELWQEHDFDLIVLDTPPSRNAIDFLDAPTRLLGFLEGRALKVFLTPGGLAARLFGRPTAIVFGIFARVTGVDLLGDLSAFFRSLSGVIDGFGAQTREVAALLRDPATVFMIVTSPESDPAREAAFLARTLDARGMRRGGLIVNRVHSYTLEGQPAERARELLAPAVGERLAARAAANLADFDVLAERDRRVIARLQRELRVTDPVLVPDLDHDVQDLAALAQLAGSVLS